MAKRPPRGIRNHNPGNIRAVPRARFEGETGADPEGYRIFESPLHGIRAISRQLLLYRRRGLTTIAKIVAAWAPPSENNTKIYIANAAKAVGVAAGAVIDVRRHDVMRKLVEAIIRQEVGRHPYPPDLIDAAIAAAGVKKES